MSSSCLQLTVQNLAHYLEQLGLSQAGDKLVVQELRGGVSNVVLLAEWMDKSNRRFVVKQSLGKLRVADDWFSERERIFREADSIAALEPVLGEGSLPRVVHVDLSNYAYVMTAASRGSISWKESLLQGQCDPGVARLVGSLLARMITGSRKVPQFQVGFADRTVFGQLRIHPYYQQAAARNPDVEKEICELIASTSEIQTALVHGDYSPKNILVDGTGIFLIDFEVVHWGDPAFDCAFLLNHLFLKSFHQPSFSKRYLELIWEFWRALCRELSRGEIRELEPMTVRHLGALMLARIDGKSPVEYLTDGEVKKRVRHAAKQILNQRPTTLSDAVEIVEPHFGELRG